MYKLPSESLDILTAIKEKIITRMSGARPDDDIYERLEKERPRDLFSLAGNIYYISFEDFGVLEFRSSAGGHFSAAVRYRANFPTPKELQEDIAGDGPIVLTDADDPLYSKPYFANFVGTRVAQVELIQGHHRRLAARPNERGIRITDDQGRQLIIGWAVLATPGGGIAVIAPDQMDPTPGLFSFKAI